MNIASTIGRIAAVIGTVSALTALTGVAQAGTSRPPSMSTAEYRSLMLRSEALDQKYGLGPQGAEPQSMTAAEALMLRSQALNKRYGLDTQKAAAVTSQPTNSTRGFFVRPPASRHAPAGSHLAIDDLNDWHRAATTTGQRTP